MQKIDWGSYRPLPADPPVKYDRTYPVMGPDGKAKPVRLEVWVQPLDVPSRYLADEKANDLVRQHVGFPDDDIPPVLGEMLDARNEPVALTPQFAIDLAYVETAIEYGAAQNGGPTYNAIELATMVKMAPQHWEALLRLVKAGVARSAAREERLAQGIEDDDQGNLG